LKSAYKFLVDPPIFVHVSRGCVCLPVLSFADIAGEVPSTPRPEDLPAASGGSVLFREIHKNAWLKRLPSTDKKTALSSSKVCHNMDIITNNTIINIH